MTEDTNYDLTQILTDGMGIKGIKNKVIATITKTIYSKALNHFGIQVYSDNYNESYDMIKVIKKFDKHNKIKLKYKCIYIINSTYLLKMRSDTYILISGHEDTNRNYKLYIYFFGKKCYDYYDYFHKELCKNDNSSTNVFNISYSSADPRGWKCIMNNVASRSFDTLFFDEHADFVLIYISFSSNFLEKISELTPLTLKLIVLYIHFPLLFITTLSYFCKFSFMYSFNFFKYLLLLSIFESDISSAFLIDKIKGRAGVPLL